VALVVIASALAYLTRPEGLLLPAALVGTLALSPRWVARGLGKRGLVVLSALVAGSALLIGPYVVIKGGLATKPSVARLLGTAPRSASHAVERQRPLDSNDTPAKTYTLAARAVAKAMQEAITPPFLALAAIGLFGMRRSPGGGLFRQAKLLALIWAASLLALTRLHATGGYCSPRHVLILAIITIPCAGSGLRVILDALSNGAAVWWNRVVPVHRIGWAVAFSLIVAGNHRELLAPVGDGFDGYREAGRWLAQRAAEGDASRVVDVTGWTHFYGGRTGYTFENLVAAPADPGARWVVVREAHLKGPWEYCGRLRALVAGLAPVALFRGSAGSHPTKVYVFDRLPLLARREDASSNVLRR
jgi:hypothetical protein